MASMFASSVYSETAQCGAIETHNWRTNLDKPSELRYCSSAAMKLQIIDFVEDLYLMDNSPINNCSHSIVHITRRNTRRALTLTPPLITSAQESPPGVQTRGWSRLTKLPRLRAIVDRPSFWLGSFCQEPVVKHMYSSGSPRAGLWLDWLRWRYSCRKFTHWMYEGLKTILSEGRYKLLL